MNIALLGTWHRRCGVPYFWRRAFHQIGHTVIGLGPWKEHEPWGTRGREPDRRTVDGPVFHYDRDLAPVLGGGTPDLLFIAEGGEGLQVHGVPTELPVVHLSSEGANMGWSLGLTPHRYANIMCNNPGEGVRWLPNAFDLIEHRLRLAGVLSPQGHAYNREYDLIQVAAPRDARVFVWQRVRQFAPDLHCIFGEAWGPAFAAIHQHGLATYVCSTLDFVTTHVMEAMAMGCVVIADRTPSMRSLFTEGEHFIGFEPVQGPGGEGMPDPRWLADTVRRIRVDGDGGMAARAYEEVRTKHSYVHRAEQVLNEVRG